MTPMTAVCTRFSVDRITPSCCRKLVPIPHAFLGPSRLASGRRGRVRSLHATERCVAARSAPAPEQDRKLRPPPRFPQTAQAHELVARAGPLCAEYGVVLGRLRRLLAIGAALRQMPALVIADELVADLGMVHQQAHFVTRRRLDRARALARTQRPFPSDTGRPPPAPAPAPALMKSAGLNWLGQTCPRAAKYGSTPWTGPWYAICHETVAVPGIRARPRQRLAHLQASPSPSAGQGPTWPSMRRISASKV